MGGPVEAVSSHLQPRSAMEAAGIEPASAAAPGRASTSVVCALISPGRPVHRRPTAGPALLRSHPSGEWLSFGASPFSDAGSLTTGRVRGDASPNYLGGECEILIRTYVVPVDLRGQPATSACSSAGEPTTSRPGRPRMCVRAHSSRRASATSAPARSGGRRRAWRCRGACREAPCRARGRSRPSPCRP
jgi:hypothetical protein